MAQSDTTNKVDENGKKIGYWIITGDISKETGYDATSKVMEGTYVRNRKNGLWIKYHKNGNVMSKVEYKNGRASGTFETYFDNGNKEETGNWKGGSYKGDYDMYYANGQKRIEKTFNETGSTEGKVTMFYANGVKELEFETVGGEQTGKAVWKYENGDIKKEQTFVNGEATSAPKEYKRVNKAYVDPNKKPAIKGPKMKGSFNGNSGLNDCLGKTYDEDKNILMDGCFKSGRLFEGRHYIYDEYGLIDHIDIYKNGEFAGNGVIE